MNIHSLKDALLPSPEKFSEDFSLQYWPNPSPPLAPWPPLESWNHSGWRATSKLFILHFCFGRAKKQMPESCYSIFDLLCWESSMDFLRTPGGSWQTKEICNPFALFSISDPAVVTPLHISSCFNSSFKGKSINKPSINLSVDKTHSSGFFHSLPLTDKDFLALIEYFLISVYPI